MSSESAAGRAGPARAGPAPVVSACEKRVIDRAAVPVPPVGEQKRQPRESCPSQGDGQAIEQMSARQDSYSSTATPS